jgi:hypothetical protein
MRLLLPLLAAVVVSTAALAHDPGFPFHDWFLAQKQEPNPLYPNSPPSSCCGDNDGYVLAYEDLRVVDGVYEVRIKNVWWKYNLPVNPYHENPTGKTWVWYNTDEMTGKVTFLCLRLSTGS